jgi:hypothetical protein
MKIGQITCLTKMTLSATCIILLAGCGTTILSHRDTNPVIEDHASTAQGKTNIFATTASRRLAFISTDSVNGKEKRVICSEPPPDVGEAFASTIAAGLSGAVDVTSKTGQKISGELATQYARAVATEIAPLLYRSQGLQFYRDAMYKLCIDRMNGWIKKGEYLTEKQELRKAADAQIQLEIQQVMKETAAAFYTNAKNAKGIIDIDALAKILAATQGKSQASSEDKSKE